MTGLEAFRIARATIAKAYDLELATVSGKSRMIPSKRNSFGLADSDDDQAAADAYNWLSDNQPLNRGH